MRVLVRDHRHVVVAVHAGRVEGARDRLPQVHVRDRRLAVGRRELVGVVAGGEAGRAAADAAGLGVAAARGRSPRPPRPKLNDCRFQAASVKPRWYAQSCIRLCIANRFARAASMSLRCGDVNVAGLQRCSCHWFVHGYAYSRSGRGVARSVPTECASLLNQLWTANALLPLRGERRGAGARVDVPRLRRRRVADHAARSRRPRASTSAARVSRRWSSRAAASCGRPSTSGCRRRWSIRLSRISTPPVCGVDERLRRRAARRRFGEQLDLPRAPDAPSGVGTATSRGWPGERAGLQPGVAPRRRARRRPASSRGRP